MSKDSQETEVCRKVLGANGDIAHNRKTFNQLKHEGWKAVKRIPNVKDFKIEIQDFDDLFMKHGIQKRKVPIIIYDRHTNSSYNRYIKHQFARIERYSKLNPTIAWRVGINLIRRSNVFLTMAFNHVFPKWHREMKLSSVLALARRVRKLTNNLNSKLIFTREYILKPNGKIRPLGVPTPAWRLYLHMLNIILTFYLEAGDYGHPSQHGFRPGRGTLTAWKVILEKVIYAKDIFEFDLKGYFDSINIGYIDEMLSKIKVPTGVRAMLYYFNSSPCIVRPPYLMNEHEHTLKRLHHKNMGCQELYMSTKDKTYSKIFGVPQGAPTSPALANLAMHESILSRPTQGNPLESLAYADDGLWYGNITQPLITPNTGMVRGNITINTNKSGWVKKDGIWLKPLKFLGLEYNGITNILKAATRNGAELKYNKTKLIEDQLEKLNFDKWYEGKPSGNKWYKSTETWENLIKSKLFGFIQSRLYQGKWNLDDLKQSFKLDPKSGSLIEKFYETKVNEEKLTVFNSTTFASAWLIEKLRSMDLLSSKTRKRVIAKQKAKELLQGISWRKDNENLYSKLERLEKFYNENPGLEREIHSKKYGKYISILSKRNKISQVDVNQIRRMLEITNSL